MFLRWYTQGQTAVENRGFQGYAGRSREQNGEYFKRIKQGRFVFFFKFDNSLFMRKKKHLHFDSNRPFHFTVATIKQRTNTLPNKIQAISAVISEKGDVTAPVSWSQSRGQSFQTFKPDNSSQSQQRNRLKPKIHITDIKMMLENTNT